MHAARSTERHIVAFEGDSSIFEEVLQPLQVVATRAPAFDEKDVLALSDEDEVLPDEDQINLCE